MLAPSPPPPPASRRLFACLAALALAAGPACDGDTVAGAAPDAAVSADAADTSPPVACRADQCDVDGVCWDDGASPPDDPCLACVVLVDRAALTPNDGAVCDDDDACTSDDACVDGACVGEARVCEDEDPCTADSCDPETGECRFEIDPGVCGEDPCEGPDGPPDCDDLNPCTSDTCVPWVGCVHTPKSGPCDDGDACTTGDHCVDGACVATDTLDCDDDDLCTVDLCRPDGGCDHLSIAHLCADANPCTDERCDPDAGCVYPFNTAPCDDGDACTVGDTCVAGACVGAVVNPDDLNPCTDDACDPVLGVVHVPNTLPCDDGDACTVGDTCAAGLCRGGGASLDCDDDNVCTTDACDPAVGCVHVDNTLPCDDGDACTVGDTCGGGACVGASLDCDDGNACTLDWCDPATGCRNELVVSNACRPTITVTSPGRAATVTFGGGMLPVLAVTGTVTSGAGPITAFTVNGQTASVNPDTGAFTYYVVPRVGGNMLVLEATDALGSERRRVQSYLWSTGYRKPTTAKNGIVPEGVGVWLSKTAIDDNNRSLPPNDLATIVELALRSFDIAGLIPNPAATNADAGGLIGRYNVYLSNLTYNLPKVTLTPISGGIRLRATITNGRTNVTAKKTCSATVFGGCWGPGTVTGNIRFNSIVLVADVQLSVSNRDIVVTIPSSSVTISGTTINIDGVLGFLIEWVLGGFIDGFVDDIESTFNSQMRPVIRNLVRDALRALAFNTTFNVPRVGASGQIPLTLVTDFASVAFNSAGGRIRLRAGAYTSPKVTPWDNSGVPNRVMCNAGTTQNLVIPGSRPLELALADDMLNQLLYASWRGGLLEFPVPASWLSGADLSSFGITDLSLVVSGRLAPTASDCHGGGLKAHLGDIRVNMSMKLFGQPLTGVVWVSGVARVSMATANGKISLKLDQIERVETEVNVNEEGLIVAEGAIRAVIEDNLIDGLMGSLGGTELGNIPLPDIDLSGAIPGLPANTRIRINPQVLYRSSGNTVVGGTLN